MAINALWKVSFRHCEGLFNSNSDAVDTLLPVTTKYTDVLFYQMYGKYEVQRPILDRWSKNVDLPIINGDSA